MSDKNISYWRDSAFAKLDEFSKELKANPEYILLAEYAALKVKGLRKQAYKKLDEFIVFACSFADTKRRKLVRLICLKHEQWGESFYLFDTYPLTDKVIQPTLEQWIIDEPQNPEPLKWLGLFYCRNGNYGVNNSSYFTALERSLALNPKDDVVREALINRYLGCLEDATHHVISDSFYIGDPSKDLMLCATIKGYIKNLQDKNVQIATSEELKGYRQMIEDWQEYANANVKMSFTEWRCLKKLP